ncbi:TonB-dependent receptor [Sphingobacterium sp. UT-1RO-CII-1]|uniref:TonB-dependent receptor n=1 Tax=Sphingobacterium sp. UT-1RO-CII-1 TaxID=2995225 RepID=UPI00227BD96F|nr:TonB-dependent receptor [Sphingobacterium sp. UT-1RO-CII-1]MCY4779152.1 TonB-dependent receptor [Sphingobacterium sp. UT-1RO-CII-1]
MQKVVYLLRFSRLFLMLAFVLFVLCSKIFAQDLKQKIAVELIDTSIKEAFVTLHKKTGFIFSYGEDIQKYNTVKVSLSAKEISVEEALDAILKKTNLKYTRQNSHFLIEEKAVKSTKTLVNTSQTKGKITGKIEDNNGKPIADAALKILQTDYVGKSETDGSFTINISPGTYTLEIGHISYITHREENIIVKDDKGIDLFVVLQTRNDNLDEVVVTAWGRERKNTVVGSVSTVSPKELRGPTSNLTSMLQGRVAGLISYQTSGEPGRDNAEFFIRGVGSFGTGKVNPLILINGIESTTTELARIQPDDIEGFSILKDATATSMYGSRGANGVILISTKSGLVGKTKFNIRYESSLSTNAQEYNLADNISYMELANEASLTRGKQRLYSFDKIDKTKAGANSLLYPTNNWRDIMIRDFTQNHRVNLNVSGGSDIAKYYLSSSYRFDDGMLKTHKINDFETNVQSQSLEIRSNIDIKLTSSTNATVRINGLFDGLNGPAVGTGSDVFKSMLKANPVMFPAVYDQGYRSWVRHPLFGNARMSANSESETDLFYNPYANALSGYSEENTSNFVAQFDLSQDFAFLTDGLKGQFMVYTKRSTRSSLSRSVVPFYYTAVEDELNRGHVKDIVALNENSGREYLGYSEGGKSVWNENWIQGSLAYEKTYNNVHNVGGTVLGFIREKKLSNAGNLERSLPQRNVSLSGRLTYGYDNRYMGEFNFGYNASERFDKHNRWGFFPSVGVAWNVANEPFMKNVDFLNKLKVRLSHGLVGNDELTNWFDYGEERFFYLNMMNMDAGSIAFGTDYGKKFTTVAISRYGNPGVTWERANKTNLAFEIGVLNGLNVEVDFFKDRRNSILMIRNDIPTTMGLRSVVRANVGGLESRGFETAIDYNKSFGPDLWATVRGTFTYSRNKTVIYEEPNYPENIAHRSKIGYPWNTMWGYVAERLFIDEEDVANSPEQFGDYMAGDIKYRDVNGDGVINDNDMVPMGYPTQPEINYGFGFSLGYKDFDLSAFFSGIARVSFMVDAASITPFVREGGYVNGLLDVVSANHWSETNRDPYAFFPRLSTELITNNNRNSSWWLRDGSFFKLASVELGYQPKGKWVKERLKFDGFRVYASGSNLFKLSKFKLWDAEMKGNGMGYPLQRVVNLGVQVSF